MAAKLNRSAQPAPTTRRAALYIRVSSKTQEEDGTSLATQEQRCRAYCAEHGYTVDEAHCFIEVHTGAELWERPRLTAMREIVRQHGVDVVVGYAVDRVSRNQAHLAIVVDELERHGARLELVTEDFEQSAVGAFIRNAKAFAAELELEKIKERTGRGRRARAEAGKLMTGPRPLYGYRWNATKTAYEEDPATAPIVRRMFHDVLRGVPMTALAVNLTKDGIPTPTGRSFWQVPTLQYILHHPTYAGRG
jgi:site-specific DNA recombinase